MAEWAEQMGRLEELEILSQPNPTVRPPASPCISLIVRRMFLGGRLPADAGQGWRAVAGAALRGLRIHEPRKAGRDAGTTFSAVVSYTVIQFCEVII